MADQPGTRPLQEALKTDYAEKIWSIVRKITFHEGQNCPLCDAPQKSAIFTDLLTNQNLPISEISKRMNIPEATIKTHIESSLARPEAERYSTAILLKTIAAGDTKEALAKVKIADTLKAITILIGSEINQSKRGATKEEGHFKTATKIANMADFELTRRQAQLRQRTG